MVFFVSLLSLASLALPSVMGLTLNTPTDAVAGSTLNVTWTTVASDPTFSLLLNTGNESLDVAQGIAPSALTDTIGLGEGLAAGSYTLTAVAADDIDTVLSTSGAFNVAAFGSAAAAGAADSAAAGAAAAGTAATGAAAAGTGAAAAGTGAAAAGTGAAATGSAATAAKGKAAKGAKAGNAAAAAKGKGAARKGPRSVASVKFGRRELYRD
ncbi:hypothetical protein BDP27DRAFT_1332646 [Rhodocollybia butyracea]|uniref:Uncharacterized protein n=1 Tax=Rhodocollybia butyracea TaxID=206335 RepID=A0A9P5PKM4_9AGAR|nr:hypothetical protein BDP27DRAFT_1332646 [Rhodocollybia butyracea]